MEAGEFVFDFGEFILAQAAQAAQPFLTNSEFLGRLKMLAVRRVFEPAIFGKRPRMEIELRRCLD